MIEESEVVFKGGGNSFVICLATYAATLVAFCSANVGLQASLSPPACTLLLVSWAGSTGDLTGSIKEGGVKWGYRTSVSQKYFTLLYFLFISVEGHPIRCHLYIFNISSGQECNKARWCSFSIFSLASRSCFSLINFLILSSCNIPWVRSLSSNPLPLLGRVDTALSGVPQKASHLSPRQEVPGIVGCGIQVDSAAGGARPISVSRGGQIQGTCPASITYFMQEGNPLSDQWHGVCLHSIQITDEPIDSKQRFPITIYEVF